MMTGSWAVLQLPVAVRHCCQRRGYTRYPSYLKCRNDRWNYGYCCRGLLHIVTGTAYDGSSEAAPSISGKGGYKGRPRWSLLITCAVWLLLTYINLSGIL